MNFVKNESLYDEEKMSLANLPIAPSLTSEEQSLARVSSETIAKFGNSLPQFSLVSDGIDCPLPTGATQQVFKILALMADGQPVEIVPGLAELTVHQAATFLDETEGYVNELLDDSDLTFRQEGDQRLIQRESLLEFAQEKRRSGDLLAKITQDAQEMGLYED